MAPQHDWKQNPAPQSLVNPWAKWMNRGASNKPAKKEEVRFQRNIKQYISSPIPAEPRYPSKLTHLQHEPSESQPPTDETLLPLLSKDDKNYLIGQRLSSLLTRDQEKRVLRDALNAGKLPPAKHPDSDLPAWPDIVADIQTMIRTELEHGLAQAQAMITPPGNNVVVINQGFEKPLPGLPSYGAGGIGTANTAEVYHSAVTHAIPRKPVAIPPPLPVPAQTPEHKFELTSLQFPKPGREPFLHCAPCQREHPTRLFSPAQRGTPHTQRKCIAREGYVRLCAHKVLTWALVEACLLKGLTRQDMDSDQETFSFRCTHASHTILPEVAVYSSLPAPDDYESDNNFGKVVLRWFTTQPACRAPFNLPTELGTNDIYQQLSLSDLAPDGSVLPGKNVVCPGPVIVVSPRRSVSDQGSFEVRELPRPDSSSSRGASIDESLALSSFRPQRPYSSFNTSLGSAGWPHAAQSAETDHVYDDDSYPGADADAHLREGEMTINAVDSSCLQIDYDMVNQPVSPMTESDNYTYSYTDPAESSIASTSASASPIPRQTPDSSVSADTMSIARVTAGGRTAATIKPSAEWFAAVHPDSYSIDRWAKEGLLGLRWCSEPECKSYVGLTTEQTARYSRSGVNRACRDRCG